MQYSVVNYSELERTTRLDGEFYKPIFIENLELLQRINTQPLTNLCKVSDGNHMTIADYFQENEGIPYYRGQDINTDFFLENAKPVYIPKNIYDRGYMKRSYFKEGDVLLSIVGTVGSLSLITDQIKKSTGSCKLAILRPHKISSEYLSAFLMCKYGNLQMERNTRGAVQTGLLLEDMDQISVFTPNKKFEILINQIIKMSVLQNRNSKFLYSQAEQILLSELGLLDWKPERELAYVKNYSDAQKAERFDAEYFQPKYEEIVEAVKKYKGGFDSIKGQFKLNKKTFKKQDGKEYRYIEIGCVNISDGTMEARILQRLELPANAKIKLQKNDVIVSKVRPYRGAIGIVNNDDCIGSSAFAVLQENGTINKETLMVFLRLQPLLDFSLKFNVGTSYPVITDEDILNFPLPRINAEIQNQIKEKIIEMYVATSLSKSLLEIAKRGVEMAIEKDEQEAEKWIDSELTTNVIV